MGFFPLTVVLFVVHVPGFPKIFLPRSTSLTSQPHSSNTIARNKIHRNAPSNFFLTILFAQTRIFALEVNYYKCFICVNTAGRCESGYVNQRGGIEFDHFRFLATLI